MSEFFAELKRRHIYRVGAAYLVVAWTLAQSIDLLSQVFDLPSWIARPALVLLAVGFPVALVVAWTIEGKPQQVIASAVRAKNTGVDWALFAALAVVIILIGYQQLVRSVAPAPQTSVDMARGAAASPVTAVSIAVLPFANLSGDASQEFFSDGMTEEITAAVARIPDLRVVGRTSAFQFKGQNQDLRAIGRALSATHLLEGSVRREGNRLRITAQLIVADNGVHVWTESYNRELTGVFAVQEDIAAAIAGALRMPLGLKPGERLVSSRTDNLESYQLFLRARATFRARGTNVRQALDILETIVARDPGFAPAWGLLAQTYLFFPQLEQALMSRPIEETRQLLQFRLDKAEKAAREAVRLDSRLASGFSVLGAIESYRHHHAAAEDFYRQALALDPNDPDIQATYGALLGRLGRLKEHLQAKERARALEPLVSNYNIELAIAMLDNAQTEAAISVLEADPTSQIGFRSEMLARAYAVAGRFSAAADTVLAIPKDRYGDDAGPSIEDAARLLRGAPSRARAPESLPVLPGRLNFVYAYIGASERMMEYPERALEVGLASFVRFLFDPLHTSVRKTERFKAFARNAGLVAYWRERGWPDLCRPLGADDFVCD